MEVLQLLGGGRVLELGAGSGAMAAGVLAEMARRECLPQEYGILDVSADLRERQRALIAAEVQAVTGRVRWLDALPQDHEGVIVANEVLDAMPVERFVIRAGEVMALGVGCRDGQLAWSERPATADLLAAVRRLERATAQALPDGFASEINLGLGPWLSALAGSLRRGIVLFIDYGLPRREYYAPERDTGTMLCHFRHRFHDDPFLNPGLQDIGAWVDFSLVAETGIDAGLRLAGYTTQAHFLIGAGIGRFVTDAGDLEITQRLNISRQVMLLTLPGEMGERFKVIALGKGVDGPLQGFSTRDLSHLL
jgi:SAM-dependent MidA family methyltransferase